MSGAGLPNLSFDLSSDAYPSQVPQLFNGNWNSGGVAVLNPAIANTLNFNFYTGYGTTGVGNQVTIDLYGLSDDVYLTNQVTTSAAFSENIGDPVAGTPVSSLTIPANTLTPGRTYVVEAHFMVATSLDTTSIPGASVIASFTNVTRFLIGALASGTSFPVPTITSPPTNQTGTLGGNATFTAAYTLGGASGRALWLFNGVAVEDEAKYTISADGTTLTVKNLTQADAGSYALQVVSAGGNVVSSAAGLTVNALSAALPNRLPSVGQATTLVAAPVAGASALQWTQNGTALPNATSATLALSAVQPANAGLYALNVTAQGSTAVSAPSIVAPVSTVKLVGGGTEFPDIVHPATGYIYDQILLQDAAASVTADPGQILRISFIDLNDDIVQVEFSGPGTLTVVLENATGPALPVKYNQDTLYRKGHASVLLVGATENTHLSIFSVGTAVNSNPNLYKPGVSYDGHADLAFIAIASTNGKFGGLRAGNAHLFATKGFTGLYAPGVTFSGPVYLGDITASDTATPVYMIGGPADARITGGDLLQLNGRGVQMDAVVPVAFTAGTTSHGVLLPAQPNLARFEKNGLNVTAQVATP